jgi:hypothetical protein
MGFNIKAERAGFRISVVDGMSVSTFSDDRELGDE